MRIFVINLDRRPDRLHDTARLLKDEGLEFTRIAAVDGREIDLEDYVRPWLARWYIGRDLRGAVGCFLSHRLIWQKMIDENMERALVLEDDITLANWDPRILDANPASEGIDFLRLGYNRPLNLITRRPLSPEGGRFFHWRTSREPTPGTCAYIISQAGAKKCQAAKRIWFPVDHFDIWRLFYGLNTAVIVPPVIVPNASYSSIETGRNRSRSERLARSAFRYARRLAVFCNDQVLRKP